MRTLDGDEVTITDLGDSLHIHFWDDDYKNALQSEWKIELSKEQAISLADDLMVFADKPRKHYVSLEFDLNDNQFVDFVAAFGRTHDYLFQDKYDELAQRIKEVGLGEALDARFEQDY